MLASAASPAVRQKRSKLAPTSCQASSTLGVATTAVNVVGFFMALLSFRGFDTPSLPAQGEQRLPPIFNIQRGNAMPTRTLPCFTAEAEKSRSPSKSCAKQEPSQMADLSLSLARRVQANPPCLKPALSRAC